MDKLQVSVALALLMMLDPSSAQSLEPNCQTCQPGSYATRNCTVQDGIGYGTKCSPCTDCSVFLQETLVPCSAYTDSVCMNRTNPVPPRTRMTVPPASFWIGLGAASLSSFVVVLLVLVFTWMSCRSKGKFLKLLPLKTSPPEQKAPPPHQPKLLIAVAV